MIARQWLIIWLLAFPAAGLAQTTTDIINTTPPSQPAQTAPAPKTEKTQQPAQATTPPASTQKQPAKPAVQPKQPAPAKPVAPPKTNTIIEAELSGVLTNQLSDSVFARLRMERKATDRLWFVRTTYAATSQDTVSGARIITTKTNSTRIDTELRRNRNSHYNFITGIYNVRGRNPANRTYPARSGYYLLYGGAGKPLGRKTEGGLGIGLLRDYDDGHNTAPALVLNFQGNTAVNKRLTFDGRVFLIQPTDRSVKLDGEIGTQYLLMNGLYLRLGYTATNLITPQRGVSDWNRLWRLSLLFRLRQ